MKLPFQRAWQLRGWDTFAGEAYFIGRYFTEAGARRAARRHLRRLAQSQDRELRDTVALVRPDGSEEPISESRNKLRR